MNKTATEPKALRVIEMSPELKQVQSYMPISASDKENLRKSIIESGIRDNPKAYKAKVNGKTKVFLLTGFNRFEIAQDLGYETIEIDFYDGTSAERQALAISDNLDRRHLTTEQKRNLISVVLKASPELSNRQIATSAKVDHKTVQVQRVKLESSGEIPQMKKTKGKDGKVRTASPKRPEKITPRITKNQVKKSSGEFLQMLKFNIVNLENLYDTASTSEKKKLIKSITAFLKKLK